MEYMVAWNQPMTDRFWSAGSQRMRGVAPRAHRKDQRTGEARRGTDGTDLFARLNAQGLALRESAMRAQREYEAGRLSLDQELAAFRAIEREMAAICERLFNLEPGRS